MTLYLLGIATGATVVTLIWLLERASARQLKRESVANSRRWFDSGGGY